MSGCPCGKTEVVEYSCACPLPPCWPDQPLVPFLPHSRPTRRPEPNFVAAYDIGLFAYFFLRENAVEHDCGRTVYSRVARVCKNDVGGRFLLEDTWTTFMKARLNCSRPGEVPFYYNELQGTFFLPELDLIYGIFTTNVYVTGNNCFACSSTHSQ